MQSTYEEIAAAIAFQTTNNLGNPPCLQPVFDQHGWLPSDFYAAYLALNPGKAP